jgi:glycosyltransferase involved in cell wall biosynthesis
LTTVGDIQISVVIPVYNKGNVLSETLAALDRQTLPSNEFEVIVVDDGSDDDTLRVLDSTCGVAAIRVLSQMNRGAGAARNVGAREADGRVVLFLDADMVAAGGLLTAHLHAHRESQRVLVAGRMRLPSRARGTAYGVFGESFDLGSAPRKLSSGRGLTGNLSIKAAHFHELGGFDEGYVRGQDVEFSARARSAGFTLLYMPEAEASHNHVIPFGRLCEKTRQDHSDLVRLLRDRPGLLQEVDYLADKLPIRWHRDGVSLVARKIARRVLALAPMRGMMRVACNALERTVRMRPVLAWTVWKTLASYQLVGLREGMGRFGWRARMA